MSLFNKNYISDIVRNFNDIYKNHKIENPRLKDHQNIPVNFIKKYHNFANGLILFHGMGTGKTRTSFYCIEAYKKEYPNYRIVFASSQTIRNNFIAALKEESDYLSYSEKDVEFVTSNGSNFTIDLFRNSEAFKESINFLGKEVTNYEELFDPNFLENTIYVFDEAHNFFKSVSSGEKENESVNNADYKKSEIAYKMLSNVKNVKFIFMTGTPIVNRIYDFAVGVNLVAKNKPFGDSFSDFESVFMTEDRKNITNELLLTKKILGYISYYDEEYFDASMKDKFPSFEEKIETVDMSEQQLTEYVKESHRIFSKSEGRKKKNNGYSEADFKMSLRELSNSTFKKGNSMTGEEIYKNLKINSPKIYKIIRRIMHDIKENKDHKSLVYSFFTTSTLNIIKKVLDYLGISNVMVTGETTAAERNEAVINFNKQNKLDLSDKERSSGEYADYISELEPKLSDEKISIVNVVLISSSGAEGLDLKNIETVHIVEPNWTNVIIEQAKRRAVRLNSHLGMKLDRRHVYIYIYIATFPSDISLDVEGIPRSAVQKILDNVSVDTMIEEVAMKKKRFQDQLIKVIKEGSIDCYQYNTANKCINLTRTLDKITKGSSLLDDARYIVDDRIEVYESDVFLIIEENKNRYYYRKEYEKYIPAYMYINGDYRTPETIEESRKMEYLLSRKKDYKYYLFEDTKKKGYEAMGLDLDDFATE